MSADPLESLVEFARELRAAGLAAGVDRVNAAAEALGHWGVAPGVEPYWPLRVAFCTSREDVPRFDAVYRRLFGHAPADTGPPVAVAMPAQSRSDSSSGSAEGDGGAGGTGRLVTRDFEEMSEAELREVSAWVDLLRPVPLRRTMHRRAARTGPIDPARTMRLMVRNGGEPAGFRRRRPASRPRRVLLLVDVSASMTPYSDMLLRFACATLLANPRTTEVFAVGTDQIRLTRSMAGRRPQDAVEAAGRLRTDWSGGTRLGAALTAFLRHWAGTTVVRSAIVILASDGIEQSGYAPLIRQVARIAALARTLIWVNPGGYRSVDVHIARAQDSAARVMGCHDYKALRELAEVITHA